MIRFVTLALLFAGTSAAAVREPRVVVAHAEPGLDAIARRVQAELQSAGREMVTLEQRTELGTCKLTPHEKQGANQVEVLLQSAQEGTILAEICAPAPPDQVTAVTVRGRVSEEGEFAIVVTEALHGLLLAAEERQANDDEFPASNDGTNEPAAPRAVELSVASRLALDLPTGGFWLGVVPELHVPLTKYLSFGAEVFVGFVPIEYSDAEMTLESHLVWARFGLLGSGTFGPLSLGWYLSAGPYFNRATAEAVPPREGGSDGAGGAMLGAGGQAEFPARGRFYLSGALGLSTLLPSLDYQMSQGTTPVVGRILLEGGLGLGFRFHGAKAL